MLPSPQLLNQVASFIQTRGKFSYYCLFLLGKEAGLRVSEAVNFNLNLKKKPNLYLIHGKKHKERSVFIEPWIVKELKQNHWQPQQTNRFSFAHFLQRTKKELNISKNIELTPHSLRRCFATYQANSGMPLPVLKKVLGHSSIRTTALYWKDSPEPNEKAINDQWLKGKIPKEPTKPIEEKPKDLLELPESNGEIFLNESRNSKQKLLTIENKNLRGKIKQLKQQNNDQQQGINNLQNELEKALNDKENLTKQLMQVKNEKNTLLKMLSVDLQKQQENLLLLDNQQAKEQELHQQLIAQIQLKTS